MTTIISDAGVQFAGGNIVDVRSTVPASGTYTAGDFVLEATSSARISGWKRLTTGSGHVLNTDWIHVGGLTSGTAVATTSGTSIDFTGIPSWAKRITVMFSGVSTNGTSLIQLQLGAGSIQMTGYVATRTGNAAGAVFQGTLTSGIFIGGAGASTLLTGAVVINLVSSNLYISTGATTEGTNIGSVLAGSVTLSGALDRVRLTTANGTDTFDAGSINILYE